ncbi:hypothetical protein BOTCAL_0188g00020 [Botryotinia calthae]|uniref:Uncharacterized protein n=1 Tax=Botryotinia calthae TaxID=38488 RepID=A0A4Y8D077_9HELO|nr:hypothetical protein BOTCAL_0188g00020 [Botryotinia calthae]
MSTLPWNGTVRVAGVTPILFGEGGDEDTRGFATWNEYSHVQGKDDKLDSEEEYSGRKPRYMVHMM